MIYGMQNSGLHRTTSIHNTDGPTKNFGLNTIKDMITEDNTFNALKRSTYEVIYNEVMLCPVWSADALTPIINKHGWAYDEFRNEWNKRLNDRI
jgi:hypothetical protein